MEDKSVVNNHQILFTRIVCSTGVVCVQVEMSPRRGSEVSMQDNLTKMIEAVVGLAKLLTRQANANAAQAQAQRMAAENNREPTVVEEMENLRGDRKSSGGPD